MKTTQLDAAEVWKQFEDLLAPGLNLSVYDRAVYSHLLRHSRLEGKRTIEFSHGRMAHGLRISRTGVREAMRRLSVQGALHLVLRTCPARYVVTVNLPSEVRAVKAAKKVAARSGPGAAPQIDIEKADFLRMQNLRRAIHERESGKCFYCLRIVTRHTRCLDHVIPQVKLGGNSYRNLVSACHDCNSEKKERPAEEFLRWLFRERKLNSAELRGRFRALRALKAGKLVPCIGPGCRHTT